MQNYVVNLKSDPIVTFRTQKAADSLDINIEKKLTHNLSVKADLESDYNIGLIVGASGSGKTTLAKKIFGDDIFNQSVDMNQPILELLPKSWSYEECSKSLSGIGLTSVPCWMRPLKTLSNGQKARAQAVLLMSQEDREVVVIDEWTSVVDRTVAKVMSHSIQKYSRKNNKKIILLACHYDIIDWVRPDWVIDCNKQEYINYRGSLRQRDERLQFSVRQTTKDTWKYFSKYHYLSEKIPGGKNYFYGLFYGGEQVGICNFSNYVPKKKNKQLIMHSNRVVIHPDYIGFGLGIKLVEAACDDLLKRLDCVIYAKFSSVPMYKSRMKNKKWKLLNVKRDLKVGKFYGKKRESIRHKVKTFTFRYLTQI